MRKHCKQYCRLPPVYVGDDVASICSELEEYSQQLEKENKEGSRTPTLRSYLDAVKRLRQRKSSKTLPEAGNVIANDSTDENGYEEYKPRQGVNRRRNKTIYDNLGSTLSGTYNFDGKGELSTYDNLQVLDETDCYLAELNDLSDCDSSEINNNRESTRLEPSPNINFDPNSADTASIDYYINYVVGNTIAAALDKAKTSPSGEPVRVPFDVEIKYDDTSENNKFGVKNENFINSDETSSNRRKFIIRIQDFDVDDRSLLSDRSSPRWENNYQEANILDPVDSDNDHFELELYQRDPEACLGNPEPEVLISEEDCKESDSLEFFSGIKPSHGSEVITDDNNSCPLYTEISDIEKELSNSLTTTSKSSLIYCSSNDPNETDNAEEVIQRSKLFFAALHSSLAESSSQSFYATDEPALTESPIREHSSVKLDPSTLIDKEIDNHSKEDPLDIYSSSEYTKGASSNDLRQVEIASSSCQIKNKDPLYSTPEKHHKVSSSCESLKKVQWLDLPYLKVVYDEENNFTTKPLYHPFWRECMIVYQRRKQNRAQASLSCEFNESEKIGQQNRSKSLTELTSNLLRTGQIPSRNSLIIMSTPSSPKASRPPAYCSKVNDMISIYKQQV